MTRNERFLILGVTALLFVLTFGYSFQKFARVPLPDEPSQSQAQTVIGENAEAVVHYLLSDGQVAKTEVGTVTSELVGKGVTDIRRLKPEWSIVSFAEDRIVANRPCPEQTGPGGFVRLADDHVGIFLGELEGCHRLIDVTEIEVEQLPEPVRALVNEGIPFHDRQDLPQVLDGLRGLR